MAKGITRAWIQQRLACPSLRERDNSRSGALVDAAVLVPLVAREAGTNVVLTRRTEGLRAHSGQISFPGGRVEPGDTSVTLAALRETEEEIGVAARDIDILGPLPRYPTGTGFLISPIVGLIEPSARLRPCPSEVAEIFEVPLTFIRDARNHRAHYHEHAGSRYRLIAMPYGDYYIWGATAGILHDLYRLLG